MKAAPLAGAIFQGIDAREPQARHCAGLRQRAKPALASQGRGGEVNLFSGNAYLARMAFFRPMAGKDRV
jgi:hypothetical protein